MKMPRRWKARKNQPDELRMLNRTTKKWKKMKNRSHAKVGSLHRLHPALTLKFRYVSVYISVCVSASLCTYVFVSLAISHSLSASHSLCVCLSLCVYVSVFLCTCLCLSVSLMPPGLLKVVLSHLKSDAVLTCGMSLLSFLYLYFVSI